MTTREKNIIQFKLNIFLDDFINAMLQRLFSMTPLWPFHSATWYGTDALISVVSCGGLQIGVTLQMKLSQTNLP